MALVRCSHPIRWALRLGSDGAYHPAKDIIWNISETHRALRRDSMSTSGQVGSVKEVYLPCGKCLECRLNYVKTWSARAYLESLCHSDSVFLTLTYAPPACPPELNKKHYQDFLKRLRNYIAKPIRVFGCGEYGSVNGRPHFHFIIFGCSLSDFGNLTAYRPNGNVVYSSVDLSSLWSYGFHSLSGVSARTMRYVARYTVKKQSPVGLSENFQKPFLIFPRRPGLGFPFLFKFAPDLEKGYFIYENRKIPIPLSIKNKLKNKNYIEYLKMNSKIMEHNQDSENFYGNEEFDSFWQTVAREAEYYQYNYSKMARADL